VAGALLDAQCSGCDHPTQALEIDDVVSMVLKGIRSGGWPLKIHTAFTRSAMTGISGMYWQATPACREDGGRRARSTWGNEGGAIDYLYKTMAETLSGADYIFEQSKLRPSTASYPNTEIGRNLHTMLH